MTKNELEYVNSIVKFTPMTINEIGQILGHDTFIMISENKIKTIKGKYNE